MPKDKYIRKVQTSVTNFIHFGDEYLFLKRGLHKKIDAGKLNATGGRLEPEEDFLQAVIRETKEETGIEVSQNQISFCGIIKIEGGYEEDWIVGIFNIEVTSKTLPIGPETEDGTLIWLHKDKVLDSQYTLVDDVKYYFKDLTEGKSLLFMNAQMDENEQVKSINISKIAKTNS